MTYEHSAPNAWQQTEFPWMSFAEGSPARTSALPEKAQGLPASGRAYGANTQGSLARYDPASSSWKTSQHCLVGGLETFSETYPRSGMMRSGIAYRLPPLALATDVIVSGFFPTPGAWDSHNGRSALALKREIDKHAARGVNKQIGLRDMASSGMWPTPTTQDAANNGGPSQSSRNSIPLNAAVGGALNPTWVEWLMGFPLGWTALEDSATPLSRKSRS